MLTYQLLLIKMILIISFNARAIAHLAKKLGLEIAIVDFWGDRDIFSLSDKVSTIFKPELKSYHVFPNKRKNEEMLVDLALEIISEEQIDGVLIGSGLDDRPDLLTKIGSNATILGNDINCIKTVRELRKVHNKLQKEGIRFPSTLFPNKESEILSFSEERGFPFVIKPIKSMGGVGIRLIKNRTELDDFLDRGGMLQDYYIQEYIRGIDISTTIVGNTLDFQVISINKQLIGKSECGTSLPFKYCGNIIPFECPPDVADKIKNASLKISARFKMTGVFGIDFVLSNNEPFFMEINPRFPGTIELIEMGTKINPVKLHLNAVRGYIPCDVVNLEGVAMKAILFAKTTFLTPNFRPSPYIVDVPFPNIQLHPEDPICAVQIIEPSYAEAVRSIDRIINHIFLECKYR